MASRSPMGNADEVCAFADISKATLYDQRHRGVGLGSLGIKIGKHLRWRWEDIDRYLDEQLGKTARSVSSDRPAATRRRAPVRNQHAVAPQVSQSGDGDRAA